MITVKLDEKPGIKKGLGFFRFRKLNDSEYVLTNELGDYMILENQDFDKVVKGKTTPEDPYFDSLIKMGIIQKDEFPSAENIIRYRNRNLFTFMSPLLHIVVVTLRCNLKCTYCQASARKCSEREFDMNEETAKQVVDIAFKSPNQTMTFEFQGGEPLVNWPIIEFVIKYAGEKALAENKTIYFSLVSNLIAMTDEILQFLVENEVGITTSIDGPEELHDKHRGKGSYKKSVEMMKKCDEFYKEKYVLRLPGALMTMTADSLAYPKEIVDEYVNLGLEAVQFRKVSPFGLAAKDLKKFTFSDDEYLKFFEEAFDYIIELNKKGTTITERTVYLILLKMMSDFPVNHMDLRSPCGAGIGQLAYNYNGDVYTCDEGRMMSRMGVEEFKLGNVAKNTYGEIIDNETVKALCVSSCLESLPACDLCAYRPYCGVCPVYNYQVEGDIFSKTHCNDRCRIMKGIIDLIISRGKDPETANIYSGWIKDLTIS